jgi:hypothetical protein
MNGRAYKETVKVTYLYKTLQNSCLDPDEPVPYSRSSILATQTFRRIAILVVQSYVRDASGEPRLHLHLLSIVAASISPSHDPGSTGVNEVLYHFHLRVRCGNSATSSLFEGSETSFGGVFHKCESTLILER